MVLVVEGARPAGRRIRWLDDEGIGRLPDPTWLVDQVLPAGGLSLMYGKPDQGKTFVALDLALCIATGTAWHGHEVQQAPTAYVIGEGQSWIKHRLDVWKVQNQWAGRTGAFFTADPLSLMDERDVTELIAGLHKLPQLLGLLVLDTMNRTMGAADESKTQDMTAYVAGCDRVRHATGAHVQVLHHSGWDNTNRERGSSVFRGAADTVIEVAKSGDLVAISPIRQRNGTLFEKLHLQLVPHLQSCALADAAVPDHELAAQKQQALEALARGRPATGATFTEWLEVSGLARTTFYRTRTVLVAGGYVSDAGSTRGGKYQLTARGRQQIGSEIGSE